MSLQAKGDFSKYLTDNTAWFIKGPVPPELRYMCARCFDMTIGPKCPRCDKEKTVLFDIVIIEKPTKKQEEDGALEKILFGPKTIPARDKDHAKTLALLHSEFTAGDATKSRVEVIVRPFA
jgi:hypothetical protein